MNEVKALAIPVELMADLIESSTILPTEPSVAKNMNVIRLKKQGCESNLVIVQSPVGDAVLMGLEKDITLIMPSFKLAA